MGLARKKVPSDCITPSKSPFEQQSDPVRDLLSTHSPHHCVQTRTFANYKSKEPAK